MHARLIRMHARALALLVAAAVTAGGVALTSCGADEATGVDAAEAAQATKEKGTARMEMRMRVTGLGLPAPITIKADGVTALDENRARLTMDFGPVLGLLGAPGGTEGEIEMIMDGADLHVKPPKIDALPIPGGKSWIAVDLRAVAEAAGLPTKGLGAFFTLDPASQLRAFKAAKGMEEVGKEDVDGVETTHFKGTYRVSDLIAALPKAEREEAQKALDALDRLDDGGPDVSLNDPIPAELWIDDEGVTRRMRTSSKLPGQSGVAPGSFVVEHALSDFGTKLDTSAPPASDTYDATEALSGAMKNAVPMMKDLAPTPE